MKHTLVATVALGLAAATAEPAWAAATRCSGTIPPGGLSNVCVNVAAGTTTTAYNYHLDNTLNTPPLPSPPGLSRRPMTQIQAEAGGTDTLDANPTDPVMNTYTNNGSEFDNNWNLKAVAWTSNGSKLDKTTNKVTKYTNKGLGPNSTIKLTYNNNSALGQMAMAVCAPGAANSNAEGDMGPSGQGAGLAPPPSGQPTGRRPPTAEQIRQHRLRSHHGRGGASQTWTESCGYIGLGAVSDGLMGINGTDVVHVAYAIVGAQAPAVPNAPPPYCARTSGTGAWATNSMAYRLQTCGLTTGGAGPC